MATDPTAGRAGPPETRGRTQIATRVLEKITARTLTEIEQAGGTTRSLLGMPLGQDGADAPPRVTAHVDGHLATVQMKITVVYPAPIRQVTRRLRTRVIARLGELTGLDIRQVDIDLARLVLPGRQMQATTVAALEKAGDASNPPSARSRPDPAARRAAARAFRPRRVLPAVTVAAVMAVTVTLTAIEVISRLVYRPAGVLPVDWLSRLSRETSWNNPTVLLMAGLVTGIGALLVFLALWPGRGRPIALQSATNDVVIGIIPGGLRRHLVQAAETVDGITHTKVTISRRTITVHNSTPLRDPNGLDDQVRQAVTARLDALAPLRHRQIDVTVRRRKD